MPTYKDEKTGLWYCKFVFTDWTGKKTQKKKMGFKLQKEAKAYETEFLSKAHASCDMLFSSLVELYMEDCKPRLKPTTKSPQSLTSPVNTTGSRKILPGSAVLWERRMRTACCFGRWMSLRGSLQLLATRLFPLRFSICFSGLECVPEKCLR